MDCTVIGGTGHVGSAVAKALLARGVATTVVTHDPAHAPAWEAAGARVAVLDIHDTPALRRTLATAQRAFVLNPPAAPDTDTDAVERASVRALVAGLEGATLERVVVHSTYGAQAGDRLGDLNVLHDLEQAVQAQAAPCTVLRAAYYFSNWDAQLDGVRRTGALHSMFPADFTLPMVTPDDLGAAAARLLLEPELPAGPHAVRYVEGPQQYSPADVAAAFAAALGREVRVVETPRAGWEAAFRALGFSEPAAASCARMTGVVLDSAYTLPDAPDRGPTTLQAYMAALVARG